MMGELRAQRGGWGSVSAGRQKRSRASLENASSSGVGVRAGVQHIVCAPEKRGRILRRQSYRKIFLETEREGGDGGVLVSGSSTQEIISASHRRVRQLVQYRVVWWRAAIVTTLKFSTFCWCVRAGRGGVLSALIQQTISYTVVTVS